MFFDVKDTFEIKGFESEKEDNESIVLKGKLGFYLFNYFADKSIYKDYITFIKDKRYIPFNDNFHPDDTVKRFQFAIVLTRIVFEKELETYYENAVLPKDLKNDEFYFNAVLLVLGLGLMENKGEFFYPYDYLRFKDMINAFEKIKKYEMGNK